MGGLTNPNPGPLTVDDQTEIEFWSGVLEEHQNRQMLQLIVKRGIVPQLRTPTSGVCSIGYNRRERKWYGWSHRAIFGFRVGSVVKQGDCVADTLPVGFRAKTLGDAKRLAEAFAESVS
jgi:hypothetical protein